MKLKLWRVLGRIASKIGISSRIKSDSSFLLMFHHVGSENEKGLSTEEFERIIEYISSNYEVAELEEVIKTSGKQKAAITFDDAYQNFYENALPVLEKYEVPTTVYLNPDFLTENGEGFPEQLNNDEKIITLNQAKKLSQKDLVSIQNHGKSHRDLTELESEDLEEEIAGGKESLEEILGLEVDSFCYPFGHFNEETRKMALETHSNCTTVRKGFVSAETERSRIPRIDGQQDLPVLKWELTKIAEMVFRNITVNQS